MAAASNDYAYEWETVLPLLDKLLALSPPERSARLTALRSESPRLADQIESLLQREELPDHPLIRALDAPRFHAMELRALQAGDHVGRYMLRQVVGRGGQGVVFEAFDAKLSRTVAIKCLLGFNPKAPGHRENFFREVEAASLLNHENICPILEGAVHEGIPLVVMRYLEGSTLRQVLNEWQSSASPASQRTALAIKVGESVARALAAAHAVGIVHRDIKPSNVMVLHSGAISVLDFGISHLPTVDNEGHAQGRMGTPAYLSPEQIAEEGKPASPPEPKSDVHALGVLLYEIFAGQNPFRSGTREGLYRSILTEAPRDLYSRRLTMPKDFRTLIDLCLQKEPAKRPSAALLTEEFARIRTGQPIQLRRVPAYARCLRLIRRHPRQTGFASVAILSIALAAGVTSWSSEHMNTVAWAAERTHQERVADAVDRAFTKALMGESPSTAFAEVLQWDPTHALARRGIAVLTNNDSDTSASTTDLATADQKFLEALAHYQRAKAGSIAAANEALQASYGAALAAEELRQRNIALLAFSAQLAGHSGRLNQASSILETQWPETDETTQAILAHRGHLMDWAFPPDSSRAQLDRARRAVHAFDPHTTLGALPIVFSDAPDHPEAACLNGRALSQLGRYDEAKSKLEHALLQSPKDASIRTELAAVLLLRGDAADAVVHARIACAADQPTELARATLAHALTHIARVDEALMILSGDADSTPGARCAETHHQRGTAFLRCGKDNRAVAEWRSCLSTSEHHVRALLGLATSLERLGDIAAAREHLTAATQWAAERSVPLPDPSKSLQRLDKGLQDMKTLEKTLAATSDAVDPAEQIRLALFASEVLKRHDDGLKLLKSLETESVAVPFRPGHRFRAAKVAMKAYLLAADTTTAALAIRWMGLELSGVENSQSVPVPARRSFLMGWHDDPVIQKYRAAVLAMDTPERAAMDSLWLDLWRVEANLNE